MFDIRATDDKHIVAIELEKNKLDKTKISKLLKTSGASEVNEKQMD